MSAHSDIRNANLLTYQLVTTGPTGVPGTDATLLTAVRVATTVAGTLASSFENGDTVDGVVLATNDRILIKNQVLPATNGIYVVQATGAPVRSTDADTGAEIFGKTVNVTAGTANAGKYFTLTNDFVPTLGTTSLVFAESPSTGVTGAWRVRISNSVWFVPGDAAPTNGVWTDITADFDPAIPDADGTGQSYPLILTDIGFRHVEIAFTPTNGTAFVGLNDDFNQYAYAFAVAKSNGN